MTIGSVSFGRVTAVTGKEKRINKLNSKMKPQVKQGNVIVRDVTDRYRYASLCGSIAQAVNDGNKAFIYVTGDDVEKINNNKKGWDTLDGILSNMSQYINLNNEHVNKAFNKIV